MKKILLMLSTLALMLAPAIANAGNFTMGVTFSDNSLDTDGTEDIDSNGTIDGEKASRMILWLDQYSQNTQIWVIDLV